MFRDARLGAADDGLRAGDLARPRKMTAAVTGGTVLTVRPAGR